MDKRTVRGEQSRAALKAAFLELFQTKEPEEISVVELCGKAGVHRSTFYAHYDYMDLLIREVLRDSIAEVSAGFKEQWDLPLEDGGVLHDIISAYVRRFMSNPTLQRFCNCADSGKYRTLIIRAQVEISLGSTADPVRYYYAYCHTAGALNCVLEWMTNGRPIPVDAITEILHEFSRVMYRLGS